MIKNKVDCVPVFSDAARKHVGFVDMFDLVLCIQYVDAINFSILYSLFSILFALFCDSV